jgi:hypothetical protein
MRLKIIHAADINRVDSRVTWAGAQRMKLIRRGGWGVSRILQAAAILVLTAATFAISSKLLHIKPEARITEAAAVSPMISPFDIMIKHGKNLSVEERWDAF